MVWTVLGIVLVLISVFLFYLSCKMYTYYGLLRDGYIFVRVQTINKVYYGWVRRNEVIGLDRITYEKFQWFIELKAEEVIVIKFEDIKEITLVESPMKVVFKGSMKRVKT